MSEKIKMEKLAKELFEVSQAAFDQQSPWKEEQFLTFLMEKHHHYFLLENETGVIGFILLSVLFETAEIELIGIRKDNQNQHLGGELIRQAKELMKQLGAETLLIEVRESNLQGIRFYQKEGFVEMSRRKNYYHHPKEDALILQLTL